MPADRAASLWAPMTASVTRSTQANAIAERVATSSALSTPAPRSISSRFTAAVPIRHARSTACIGRMTLPSTTETTGKAATSSSFGNRPCSQQSSTVGTASETAPAVGAVRSAESEA